MYSKQSHLSKNIIIIIRYIMNSLAQNIFIKLKQVTNTWNCKVQNFSTRHFYIEVFLTYK